MVNKERMVEEFLELVAIDSLTLKERKMADTLKKKLEGYGIEVFEDEAGSKIGGEAGNIIGTMRGNKELSPILLMAHMDTVVPGVGKKAILEGDVIKTDGTTILGGDDVAGIECILEAIRVIKEDGIQHGDIQIVFTVAEEGGLLGAKNLDDQKIYAQYGFVMDSGGSIGTVAHQAPAQNHIEVTVKGKAAHAGLEPEKGVSAIQIASEAIAKMHLGRIDAETTANIGSIHGGSATNIVCDTVHIKAEARSRSEQKLEKQTDHMRKCFEEVASKWKGTIDFQSELVYPAIDLDVNDPIIEVLKSAANQAGIELKLEATGGGSDTNIIHGKGVKAVNISVGMDKVHSVHEQIRVGDLTKAAEFLVAIINNVH